MATPDDVAAVVAQFEPGVRQAVEAMLEGLGADVSVPRLQAIIAAGDMAALVGYINSLYGAAAAPFLGALTAAQTAAGDRAAQDIVRAARRAQQAAGRRSIPTSVLPGLGADDIAGIAFEGAEGFRYLPVNPRTVAATRSWQGNLIQQMALTERTKIMGQIRDGYLQGDNPRTTARRIKAHIGLTERQAKAVASFDADLTSIVERGARSAQSWGIYTPRQMAALRAKDPAAYRALNFTARELKEGRRWAKISRAAGTLEFDPERGLKPSKPLGFVADPRTESGPSAFRIGPDGRPIDRMTSWRLRDKRFDPIIYDIVAAREAGDEAAEKAARARLKAEKAAIVKRYRERYIAHRAEVIARTETLRAANLGSLEAWRQAVDEQNLFEPGQVRRFWVTARDDRVRMDHRAIPRMNDKGVTMHEPFRVPDGIGQAMFPPHVPNCRCSVKYEVVLAP